MEDDDVITSEEIKRKLWNGANDLRGSMDASKYKDYMLGLMFYKFLSDKTLEEFRKLVELDRNDDLLAEYTSAYEEDKDLVVSTLQETLGYYVLPEYLYQKWLEDIKNGEFELQKVMDSLNYFERTIAISEDSDDFKGLFSNSIIDLTNTALGSDLKKRSKNIEDLILLFSDLNMIDLQAGDVLGDAYEYLIAQFASNAGKKAGEFYTPHQVSEVMAQIVAKTTTVSSIYDPTVGSGSLLLTVKKHLNKQAQAELNYYGQEYITETYNLTRMNLLLHGVRPEKMNIKNGNTLAQDWPEDPGRPNEGVQFDAVVMNPPYSDKKWNGREDKPLKVSDPRFADFGVLPPDSKGDFAYLMHGLYHLGQKGTMAIVLPHGVLFRGASEGEIRKRILEKNYLDAVIGLPSNLFTNTGIPVCILILKKNRQLNDPVLVIDASNDFIKVGKQNVLREKDIAKIVDTYINKQSIEGYSHLATRQEIKENDYNMNIPRYVKAMDEEIPHDVDGHLYGGIPQKNIDHLKVLNATVKATLNSALTPVREGYVVMNKPLKDLTDEILSDQSIVKLSKDLEAKAREYLNKYFNRIINLESSTNLTDFMDEMFVEIKAILNEFKIIDIYDGYQIISDIWRKELTHDVEIQLAEGLYNAARTLVPNMIIKGQGEKKREEQDGMKGKILPFYLVQEELFLSELEQISNLEYKIEEIENRLTEIKESLSEEDGEYSILNANNDDFVETNVKSELNQAYEMITSDEIKGLQAYVKFLEEKPKKQDKLDFMSVHDEINWSSLEKNKDGTVGKAKVVGRIKELKELHRFEKQSFERKLVEILQLLQDKKRIKEELKQHNEILNQKTMESYPHLTEQQIDKLMYQKWFGSTITELLDLIHKVFKSELETLDMLNTRYSKTLTKLDEKTAEIETSFERLMSELVVM